MPDTGSITIGGGALHDVAHRFAGMDTFDGRVGAPQQSVRELDEYSDLSQALGATKWLSAFVADWLVDPQTHSKLRVTRWYFEDQARVLCDVFTGPVNVPTRRQISAKQACIREFSDYVCATSDDRTSAPQFATIRSRLVIPLPPGQVRRRIGYLPAQKGASVSREQTAALLDGAVLDLIEAPRNAMYERMTGREVLDLAGQHEHLEGSIREDMAERARRIAVHNPRT